MRFLKLLLLPLVMVSITNPRINAQEQSECLKYISYYTEYLKQHTYNEAINYWRKAYHKCPVRIGHKFYSDGADIYRHLVSMYDSPSPELLDSLVLLNAAKGHIYPEYQYESLKVIESDLARFASNNEQLRQRLIDKINTVEQFITKGDNNGYKVISKVAITNPRVKSGGNLTDIENALIKGEIGKELSRSDNYAAYTRTDVDKILEEYNFQSTGMVSENERHQIGQLSGVDYICSINVTKENKTILIEASLINIISGEIRSSSMGYCEYVSIDDSYALEITCKKIGQELTGLSSYKRIKLIPSKNKISQRGQPYVETAFGIDMPFVYIKGGITGEGTENVVFVEPYYISTFLVTQQQWTNVMGISQEDLLKKCEFSDSGNSNGAKYPIYCVTPQEALDFCKSLSSMSGLNYDLPTVAEWELAANKPSQTYIYSGSNDLYEVGWTEKSMPVGLKQANSYGIYDMTGNVAEFCKNSSGFALKSGMPWGDLNVSTKYTFKDITEETSSPYIGFRVIIRLHTNE